MKNSMKDAVRKQFQNNAGDYRDEPLFAAGEDLRYMVESVVLSGTERVLDIGTGAGHTALAFSPFVKKSIGIDLTEEMVEVAAKFAKDRGVKNIEFCVGDAENLTFSDETFDLVTCRFAAHHFPNAKRAIREISRVLKPGGIFLLVDHYAPENPDLDTFVNDLDRLRDPSHVREYRLSEYRAWFVENGLSFQEKLMWDLPIEFENWVRRARTPQDVRFQLIEFLRTASFPCKQAFRVEIDEEQKPISFCLKCSLLHGVKR
ncbi:class I SAM-dependent methyltransferase [Fodinisporobacter ferrooxydans]|uniref:Class I SAM-dependent methyltransferase n=1 Tax=Fodinisporobacter ferrooxydans TaxID=2901836 RepID=A0ABY4CHN6_9BACL|nr:class I SAM-dependent methyltransferase [Alicyclobacillaceae bacterium MYW30-H2]